MRKLTKREEAFIYWRARGNTLYESLLKADYKCKSRALFDSWGSQLESKLKIKEAIEQERLRIFDKSMITEEYVLEGLKNIAENGKQEANKVMAFQLLGRHLAMFTDKSEVKQTITQEEEANLAELAKRLVVREN